MFARGGRNGQGLGMLVETVMGSNFAISKQNTTQDHPLETDSLQKVGTLTLNNGE